MSLSSSNAPQQQVPPSLVEHEAGRNQVSGEAPKTPIGKRILYALGLPAWVFLSFMLAQALVLAGVSVLQWLGVSFANVNGSIFNATAAAIIYALSIALVIGVPWLIKRRATTREELGLHRMPSWMDVIWAPAGMVVYLILTTLVMSFAVQYLTFINFEQAQDTGFAEVTTQFEYILAFISLVIIAPIAEEVLFRGYLFGKLRKYVPLWLAILVTSALFAAVHGQWNVALDVFVLSVVMCLLRVVSKSLWPAILLHMMKNGIAYYFLFINPTLLSTLGG
ncbi:MAG: lysostaphin resistance A-like protein [Candidatus Microsaccharimonas sp.]